MLASAEVADSFGRRARGLLGRDGVDGALVLPRTRSIHTLRMRFALDVAWCDADGRVLKVAHVPPHRVTLPVRGARSVIEAEAGMFLRWGVEPGVQLEVRA